MQILQRLQVWGGVAMVSLMLLSLATTIMVAMVAVIMPSTQTFLTSILVLSIVGMLMSAVVSCGIFGIASILLVARS